MSSAKQSLYELNASDWLDYNKFSPPLVPDVRNPLVDHDMFRALRLDLSIQVVVEQGGRERDLKVSCEKVHNNARMRLRKLATTVFADVVRGWQAEQSPQFAGGGEGKKAIEAVKKLNDSLKRLIGELPREMRETAAKDLSVPADEFITVSDCDYDVRLRPDLLQDMGSGELEQEAKEANEKLKKRLKVKGDWLSCAIVWTSADKGRVFVEKPGKKVKPGEIQDESEFLEASHIPTKTLGYVYNTGSKLFFQFLSKRKGMEGGKLPGGNARRKTLKKMISEQTNTPFSVEVRVVEDYNLEDKPTVEEGSLQERSTTRDDKNEGGTKKSGKSGRRGPASPVSTRGSGN